MARVIGIRDGTLDGEISYNDQGPSKKFKIEYEVVADSLNDTSDDVLQASGLPPIGLFHRGCFLKSLKAKEITSATRLWVVTADFSSIAPDPSEAEQENPEQALPDWKWSSDTAEEVIEVDQVTGEPLVNAVGEPILITRPVSIPVLTITRIEQTFSPNTILALENHANQTTFWGAPSKIAVCDDISDQKKVLNGVPYREVAYVFKFFLKLDENGDLIGSMANPLHHGTKYLENPGDDIEDAIPFTDKHGNPTTGNLKADGTKLGSGADEEFLTFNRFPLAEFNSYNLGPY